MENIWSQIQLKGNPRQAVNNPTPVQQVKYPAPTLEKYSAQRSEVLQCRGAVLRGGGRDVCCREQTGAQTALAQPALPVHLQAQSEHCFTELSSQCTGG